MSLARWPGACPGAGVLLLVLHDSEQTALATWQRLAPQPNLSRVRLVNQGLRLLAFSERGRAYQVDPNRIFTPAGIAASLAAHASEGALAHAAVQAFSDALLAQLALSPAQVVVALHNNHPGGYSAASYLAGAAEAGNASAVHLAAGEPVDRFYLVTDASLYAPLRTAGYNVVLQDNEAVHDDGSLSVYAARRGIAYVNIETARSDGAAQAAMLSRLLDVLASQGRGQCPG